ncbi:TspO/MBR family protein [Rhodopseudomonas sp. NSM]|uniref:TspO/MBR family protein n=1 Tax=Rhodopseudomonas sp. NSM TaxID=3457630 RepID=UPI004036964A
MNPIFVAFAVAILVGLLGGSLTDTGVWYQSLIKPWWQPPDWAFGPAWTVIFALAAMSAIHAWRGARTRAQREWVVGIFAANGFFNLLWSMLFFTVQRPDWALLEVPLLWLSVLVGIVVFWRSARIASYYLVPYLLWVSFAAYLNWTVVQLNTPFS